jgi:NADH dehydrogenase (ubiquinone) 1 alpha subcomplex subunit 5
MVIEEQEIMFFVSDAELWTPSWSKAEIAPELAIRATIVVSTIVRGRHTFHKMFRLTRPLFQQVVKKTTGITGLPVHPNPLPELLKTYESTLSLASSIPATSLYRQSVEALTQNKLQIVQDANGDIATVEKRLDEGQIEEALGVAKDELKLVSNMLEWKA